MEKEREWRTGGKSRELGGFVRVRTLVTTFDSAWNVPFSHSIFFIGDSSEVNLYLMNIQD